MTYEATYDVIIVGAGPSGMSAATVLSAEGRKVLVLESQSKVGGQIGTTSALETYLSHLDISGADFAHTSCQQCLKFGAVVKINAPVVHISPTGHGYYVHTGGNDLTGYYGRSVILAVGLKPKRLGIPGEDISGVYHGMKMDVLTCPVDGAHVVLIGGGNNVGQAAMHYANNGARVTIVARYPIEHTMDSYLVHRITCSQVDVLVGDASKIGIMDNGSLEVYINDKYRTPFVDCVHVMIGQQPDTDWLNDVVVRVKGYITAYPDYRAAQRYNEGMFAIGDVVMGSVKRVAVAVGSGAAVVPAVHAYLDANV